MQVEGKKVRLTQLHVTHVLEVIARGEETRRLEARGVISDGGLSLSLSLLTLPSLLI